MLRRFKASPHELLQMHGIGTGSATLPDSFSSVEINPSAQPKEEPERVISCRSCGHTVTTRKHICEVHQKTEATFRNPAGYSFHVVLFRQAPGAVSHGEQHRQFSWFDGYRWSIAQCGRCREHLGWRFDGADQFWGLIVTRLTGCKNF